jgi:hypothetical protein
MNRPVAITDTYYPGDDDDDDFSTVLDEDAVDDEEEDAEHEYEDANEDAEEDDEEDDAEQPFDEDDEDEDDEDDECSNGMCPAVPILPGRPAIPVIPVGRPAIPAIPAARPVVFGAPQIGGHANYATPVPTFNTGLVPQPPKREAQLIIDDDNPRASPPRIPNVVHVQPVPKDALNAAQIPRVAYNPGLQPTIPRIGVPTPFTIPTMPRPDGIVMQSHQQPAIPPQIGGNRPVIPQPIGMNRPPVTATTIPQPIGMNRPPTIGVAIPTPGVGMKTPSPPVIGARTMNVPVMGKPTTPLPGGIPTIPQIPVIRPPTMMTQTQMPQMPGMVKPNSPPIIRPPTPGTVNGPPQVIMPGGGVMPRFNIPTIIPHVVNVAQQSKNYKELLIRENEETDAMFAFRTFVAQELNTIPLSDVEGLEGKILSPDAIILISNLITKKKWFKVSYPEDMNDVITMLIELSSGLGTYDIE